MNARALLLLTFAARLAAGQATVVGVVFDSLFTHAPMKGATVVIPELSRYVASDARGRFQFDSIPAGRYTMTFLHPSLDSLDISAEVLPISIPASGTVSARLATPSPAGLVWLVCRAVADTFPAMMLGHVRDVDDSSAIIGATVTVTWSELVIQDELLHRRTTQAVARARENGTFVLCGLPLGLRIDVTVEAGGRSTGSLALAPGATGVRRHDFAIGRRDSIAGTVTGVVRDARERPVPRALVMVAGPAPLSAVTDDAGVFTLRGVPAGTQLFELRQVGSWPATFEVDVPSAGRRNVALTLGRRASTVTRGAAADSVDPEDQSGFDERRAAGIGRFLSAEEIAARKPQSLADALLRLPPIVTGGTIRTPSKMTELRLRLEGQPVPAVVYTAIVKMRVSGSVVCTPHFFVNGVVWTPGLPGQAQRELEGVVDLASVRGIEVYPSATVPPMFDRHTDCGSVLIWTK